VLGLRQLGHRVFLLDVLTSTGVRQTDLRRIALFLRRFKGWGLDKNCAVILQKPKTTPSIEDCEVFGLTKTQLRALIADYDVLWNFHCSIRAPLLHEFKRKVLLDLDPGHLQVSALSWDLGIHEHDAFFSVGLKIADSDCQVPTLGHQWYPFFPPVYLPSWNEVDPIGGAPITSVTQWTWGNELLYRGATSRHFQA
jgi:hypothetical protein